MARKNSSDAVTYYLVDHLGSVVQETQASGTVTVEREYDPWGDPLGGSSSAGYSFQGREWDPEISLYYFRARYYNAAAGAWASDDPIGFGGGSNFTQFVNNNPVRFVDPLGLCGGEPSDQLARLRQLNEDLKTASPEERTRLQREWFDQTMADYPFIGPTAGVIKIAGGRVITGLNMKDAHYFVRKFERGLTSETILETLKNPAKIISKVDQLARESFQYVSDKAVIVINDAGLIITMWSKTGAK